MVSVPVHARLHHLRPGLSWSHPSPPDRFFHPSKDPPASWCRLCSDWQVIYKWPNWRLAGPCLALVRASLTWPACSLPRRTKSQRWLWRMEPYSLAGSSHSTVSSPLFSWDELSNHSRDPSFLIWRVYVVAIWEEVTWTENSSTEPKSK